MRERVGSLRIGGNRTEMTKEQIQGDISPVSVCVQVLLSGCTERADVTMSV